MSPTLSYEDILTFWFEEAGEKKWFRKDLTFDETIRQRFADIHHQVAGGELWKWRETIEGRLAEIIVLDQFSRNIFRNQPEAFQYDSLALVLSQEAVSTKEANKLTADQRAFLYMSFMHSESPLIHEVALKLFQEEGLESFLPYKKEHKAIIDRFGRYPHRNTVLGRKSTEEERAFMKEHKGF